MQYTADALNIAIDEFAKLPGIGRKSAQRLVFFLLKCDDEDIRALADSILALKDKIQYCETCFNIADSNECAICANESRNDKIICVVEEAKDVLAIEGTNGFRGV